jgi:hypothetical protein
MSRKRWKALLVSALIGAVAVVIDGCSSSSGNSTTPSDASADVVVHPTHRDAGPTDSGVANDAAAADSPSVPPFDGTSGKACMSNADCGSTGINVCSNTYTGKLNALNGVPSPQFWPTPLCMMPLPTTAGVGNCDPGDAGTLQFCDSADPGDPASPGICLPLTTPQQAGAGNGFCLPHCSFAVDGSAPMGCPGKDTCTPLTFLYDPNTNAVSGHGYCQGTCQVDTDCSALGTGFVCQTDLGVCTKTKKVRTKALGAACSNSGAGVTPVATSDTETGACNCPFSGTPATAFYCTSACVVGGTPCPSGFVCDALVPGGELTFTGAAIDGGDIVFPAPTMQNPGLAGSCYATCSASDAGAGGAAAGDGGAGDGGAGMCPGAANLPPLSTCTAPTDMVGTVAGPDCLP